MPSPRQAPLYRARNRIEAPPCARGRTDTRAVGLHVLRSADEIAVAQAPARAPVSPSVALGLHEALSRGVRALLSDRSQPLRDATKGGPGRSRNPRMPPRAR